MAYKTSIGYAIVDPFDDNLDKIATAIYVANVLCPREIEVFSLLREGLTLKQIGAKMGIAWRTVGTYHQRVVNKLGVPNANAAAILSWRLRHNLAPAVASRAYHKSRQEMNNSH